MNIILSPVRMDNFEVVYLKKGDSIFINDEEFNFSRINDGDTLPIEAIRSEMFCADIFRENGELNITLILPNPWNYSQEQAFPRPLINPPDGILELPKPNTTLISEEIKNGEY